VIGAKESGYALAFLIRSFLTDSSDASVVAGSACPDFSIRELRELVPLLEAVKRGDALSTVTTGVSRAY
jgi:hypothetical protein